MGYWNFAYLEGTWNFYFSSDFNAIYFFELIGQRASDGFVERFPLSLMVSEINSTPKGNTKSRIQKFELWYLTSNFDAVFCIMIIIMGYSWTMKYLQFFFQKNDQISKFHIFEIVKQDKCPKYSM